MIKPRPNYAGLAANVRKEVEATSLRSNPRDEYHCACECCTRGGFRGRHVPPSLFFKKEKKRGRPSDEKPDVSPIKICPKCKQEIGKGKPHSCTEKSKAEFYDSISPKSKASIAHDYINEQLAEANENGETSVSLQSKRGGRPLKVVQESAIKPKSVTITKEMMTRFRLEMDIGN